MIEEKGKYYLYRHIRLDTNEPFYIGIGTKSERKGFVRIYNRAFRKTGRSKWWKNIIAKTKYEVEIVLESDNYEFIKQKEIEFIALYGRQIFHKGPLVNLTDGGDGAIGRVLSEELRKKISDTLLPKKPKLSKEKKIHWSTLHKGNFPEETRKKMSESKKGKNKGSKSHSAKPVHCYNLDGSFIKSYGAGTEAEEDTGISHHNISVWCRREKLNNRLGIELIFSFVKAENIIEYYNKNLS